MSERFSHQQMADIFVGSSTALEDFIEKNKHIKPPRPEHWFQQQHRELLARKQAATDYQRAAIRAATGNWSPNSVSVAATTKNPAVAGWVKSTQDEGTISDAPLR